MNTPDQHFRVCKLIQLIRGTLFESFLPKKKITYFVGAYLSLIIMSYYSFERWIN